MKCKHLWLLALAGVLGACAADGGSRGSGISTSLQGNIAAGSPAIAVNPLEGIHVTVEETGTSADTDSSGHFALTGSFRGRLTVLFELPVSAASARMTVNLPAGGALTLNDVRLNTESGHANADTQDIYCEGVVADTDCTGMTLTMMSIESPGAYSLDSYVIRLDSSTLLDASGHALSCTELRYGDELTVDGVVNADGTFGYAVVRLH